MLSFKILNMEQEQQNKKDESNENEAETQTNAQAAQTGIDFHGVKSNINFTNATDCVDK